MFISASDNKDDRLSNFAENVEVHFASRKKTEILAKARNLLLQSDFAISHVSFQHSMHLLVVFCIVLLWKKDSLFLFLFIYLLLP